ncbi:MAG: archease [Candidatus Aminicenantes bacterium]|nr:archease [Candidatus Aminicenantes bacterium]
MKKYEMFATTADVGIRFCGRNFAELYENAVAGLNGLLFGEAKGTPADSGARRFSFHGDSAENVLVNLLAEVLSLVYQKNKRVTAVVCRRADESSLDADLRLARIDGEPGLDIKAVTYHKLQVVEKNGVKRASIFFDV